MIGIQYAIDDIALEYNAEPPIPVSTLKFIEVGNVLTCAHPSVGPPVCIQPNRYTVYVSLGDKEAGQDYVDGKAQAELNTITHAGTFTNSSSIALPGGSIHPPVATSLAVTGLLGVVSKVTLTINPIQPNNGVYTSLMILLKNPTGQVAEMMFGCGPSSSALFNVSIVYDDNGPLMDLIGGFITSGTFHPTSSNPNTSMSSPAPAAPYTVALSALNGHDPNGTWTLWAENRGGIALEDFSFPNGFSLQITTV